MILITNQIDQFDALSKEDPNWDARPASGLGIKRAKPKDAGSQLKTSTWKL